MQGAEIPEIELFNTKFNRREKIWSNLESFREQKTKWYNDNFKKMDAEAIVKTVQKFAKENIDMKNRLKKDEKDEVLDDLSREVKEVEAQKALILALGQKAMQPRHWTKVYAELNHQAPNLEQGIILSQLTDELNAMDKLEEI